MPTYIEALNTVDELYGNSIFLAGGITGCVDWQKIAKEYLMKSNYDFIVNPRRENFDVTDETQTPKQILWEAKHLSECTDVMFWFSSETVQPITLFELGVWCIKKENLIIGCDPEYSRRFDVITQLGIYRPDIKVWDNLDDMMEHIIS